MSFGPCMCGDPYCSRCGAGLPECLRCERKISDDGWCGCFDIEEAPDACPHLEYCSVECFELGPLTAEEAEARASVQRAMETAFDDSLEPSWWDDPNVGKFADREMVGDDADFLEDVGCKVTIQDRPLRIAFDVGGVLSKYPDIIGRLIRSLEASNETEVFILSDMPGPALADMLGRNGLGWIGGARVVHADYSLHGEACKAEACRALEIDILVDDFIGYVAVPGAPLVRLLVMPDASLDYYHPDWKTDGSEGQFGRRLKKDKV